MSIPDLKDLGRRAQIVDSLYRPVVVTLGDALSYWRGLDPKTRSTSYLIVDGDEPTVRHTLNAKQVEQHIHF